MSHRLIPLTLVFLCACTTVNYESPRFGEEAGAHRSIAVLPFAMVFTGKVPARLTPAQIAAIEEAESLAFQAAFYDRLLNQSSAHRKRPIRVEIQPVATTNRILEGRGISVRRSWEMEPEELARILGVDAVVRTSVEKTRYLSELASWGIEAGIQVAHAATEGELFWVLPPGLAKTHDIWADSALLSGDNGYLLWRVAVHRETDWQRPANDVVLGVTKKLAKKFPYRG